MVSLKTKLLLATGGPLAIWTTKEWIEECKINKQISLPLLLWKSFPARTGTLLWGKISKLRLPLILREPLFHLYSKLYNCNLNELPDGTTLKSFGSINEFFTRKLPHSCRPIHPADVVSCCDGTIIQHGMLDESNDFKLDSSVKGLSLTANMLTGSQVTKRNPGNSLFYFVLYLGPGDYHRFHAPFDVSFDSAGHFNGELMPVNPKFFRFFPSVFSVNERMSLIGEWKHGYVAYCPVSALGVGNISINRLNEHSVGQEAFTKSFGRARGWNNALASGLNFGKGAEIGKFEMGSTVVVVFEAPSSFQWTFGQAKVKVGQELGTCKKIVDN